jgi:hypothetical protein
MKSAIVTYLIAHPEVIVGAFFGVLNAIITFLLYLNPSLANWVSIAEKSPRIASLVRLLGALGIQPIQALQAIIDFVRGHASPGTLASAKNLQVSSSRPLISPASPSPPPPPPPPPPP